MQQIETLYLPDSVKSSYQNVERQPLTQLDSLSRVNILVGANNSGKSRFMRLLAVEENYDINLQNSHITQLRKELIAVFESIKNLFNKYSASFINGIDINMLMDISYKIPSYINTSKDYLLILRENLDNIAKFTRIDSTDGKSIRDIDEKKYFLNEIISLAKAGLSIIYRINIYPISKNNNQIYIPTLRGLRPLDSEYTDFYQKQTIENYFNTATHRPDIYTGLGLYKELRSYLLGTNDERKKIREYQDFISNSLFEGKEITLISNEKKNYIVVKIGNEEERSIYELGDGIQSAIILTFLPFIEDKNCIFFIEEPELFLHPSMQRKILEFYHSLDRHLFFMTTHSNHLLDITIDIPEISIYSFQKLLTSSADNQTPQFVVENVDNNQSSSLELLGVRNSSVLLVNATIWVEGITDRWYLREMLRMYMETLPNPKPKLEEDIHYAFVEYGGGNITHFSFLDMEDHPIIVDRLCAKAIVIIDQDDEQKKLERKQKLEAKLGDRLIILPCREIENSLPPEVIRSVVIEYETSTQNPNPETNSFVYEDYQNKPLGNFIKENVIKGEKNRRGCYNSGSGTITDKLGFCTRALKYINPLTDAELAKLDTEERQLRNLELFQALPESTQQIIIKIYDFIVKLNPS